jgi:hypothetical protein
MLAAAQPGCGGSIVVVVVGGTVVVVVGGTVVVGAELVVDRADGAVDPEAEPVGAEGPEQPARTTTTAITPAAPPIRTRQGRGRRTAPFRKSCTGFV